MTTFVALVLNFPKFPIGQIPLFVVFYFSGTHYLTKISITSLVLYLLTFKLLHYEKK